MHNDAGAMDGALQSFPCCGLQPQDYSISRWSLAGFLFGLRTLLPSCERFMEDRPEESFRINFGIERNTVWAARESSTSPNRLGALYRHERREH